MLAVSDRGHIHHSSDKPRTCSLTGALTAHYIALGTILHPAPMPSHPSHHRQHHEESGIHEKLTPEETARRQAAMQKHNAEALKARVEMTEYLSQQPAWKWDHLNKSLILNEAHKALTPGNCELIPPVILIFD